MAPPPPARPATHGPNADLHLTILVALDFVGAALIAFLAFASWWGLAFAAEQGTYWSGLPFISGVLGDVAFFVVVFFLFLAVPALLGGIGLSGRKEWGRTATFVFAGLVGLFALVSVTILPLVFTFYAFWALTRPGVAGLLQRT